MPLPAKLKTPSWTASLRNALTLLLPLRRPLLLPIRPRNRRPLLRSLFLVPPLLLLGACQSVPTGLLSPDSLYPSAITACADEPKVPARPAPDQPRTDPAKAEYTKGLHDAWADCHDTVAATAARKAAYAKQFEAAQPHKGVKLPHVPNPFAKKAAP
jgi:hypothetical protein